ncbi:hypothetical protein FNU76_17660 [Chitinimonas arctica]|uniref:DUF2189 domain-containing protein n=1 Tax=Chitinimonas arctica TaxID=2594795 RepID=A0A516SIP6_9NEIS|nr:BPSS1780 family membrane protein [Chitinimonas arctica]QDQ28024.1 hypothetical protein FNU76_17660 [Chitinimonas arctica]
MQADQTPPGKDPFAKADGWLDKTHEMEGRLLDGGRAVAAGQGLAWFGSGFQLFKQSPWIWIANVVLMMLMLMVMSIIPFAGSLGVNLLMPVFIGGMMLGCLALERGDDLEIEHLFAGFKQNVGQLVLVGLFTLLYMAVVMIVCGILAFIVIGSAGLTSAFTSGAGSEALWTGAGLGMLLVVLVAMLLIIPISMAAWFAPALVIFHGLDAFNAMKQSLRGGLKNIMPFLVFSLVYIVLAIIATIPLLLGWLVLMPMFYTTIYVAYKDIFLEP